MREIILQPGTSIEIDGVVVRASKPKVSPDVSAIYDPVTGTFEPCVGGRAAPEPTDSSSRSSASQLPQGD